MPTTLTPGAGERYILRRKVFKLLGAGFHIYGPDGNVVAYCKQKAFKLREALTVYTDDSESKVLMRIGTRAVIDFSATYDVSLAGGEAVGSMRRQGMKSLIRDEWLVFDARGAQVAVLREDSGSKAIFRRLLGDAAWLLPETYHLYRAEDTAFASPLATYSTHFNPFVYKLGIGVHADRESIDDLMILALGCLVGAIEGRQG